MCIENREKRQFTYSYKDEKNFDRNRGGQYALKCWKKNKDILRKRKTKSVFYHQTYYVRMVKSFLNRKETVIERHLEHH